MMELVENEMREIFGEDHGPVEVFEYNDPQVPRNDEICRLVGSYIYDELSPREIGAVKASLTAGQGFLRDKKKPGEGLLERSVSGLGAG